VEPRAEQASRDPDHERGDEDAGGCPEQGLAGPVGADREHRRRACAQRSAGGRAQRHGNASPAATAAPSWTAAKPGCAGAATCCAPNRERHPGQERDECSEGDDVREAFSPSLTIASALKLAVTAASGASNGSVTNCLTA
jgi:hypothetical protein